MIGESAVNWTRTLYRPLRRAGQRALRKPAARTTRIARQPERYPALDHARFVLIALVVIGHLLEQLANSGPVAAALYRWIYLFHMPAFVLVSGAVSKTDLTRRRACTLAPGVLLPYVVFQTLYPAWDAWLSGTGDWWQGYLTPYRASRACPGVHRRAIRSRQMAVKASHPYARGWNKTNVCIRLGASAVWHPRRISPCSVRVISPAPWRWH
jgi:hypothetical protein